MQTNSLRFAFVLGFTTLVAISLTWLGIRPSPIAAETAKVEETPKEVIADQIRRQGFSCDNPVSAKPDPERSKPHEAAWILQCKTVPRAPHSPAEVAPLG